MQCLKNISLSYFFVSFGVAFSKQCIYRDKDNNGCNIHEIQYGIRKEKMFLNEIMYHCS